MTNTQRSIAGSFLIIVCTLCATFILNSLSSGWGWLDFTSNSRYTLNQGTHNVLAGIQRPLTAKLFYSKSAVDDFGTDQLLEFNRSYLYVRDLLRAYEKASGGKVVFEEYDPKSFSPEAREAEELGIQALPLPVKQLFFSFGLAITSDTGSKEVIPFINAREEGLFEYNITKLIEKAGGRAKQRIGILAGLPILGENMSPEMAQLRQFTQQQSAPAWNITTWLELDFEVEEVDPLAGSVPDGLDYLLVVHPKDFGDETLYAIDQYVLGGGKLVAFVDPFCLADAPMQDPSNQFAQFTHPRASDLNRLTNVWGLQMGGSKVIIDESLSEVGPGGIAAVHNPTFMRRTDGFNEDEVVTQALGEDSRVSMLFPGSLTKVESVEADVVPLIRSTDRAGVRNFTSMELMSLQQDPRALSRNASAANPDGVERMGTSLAAAVRVTGLFNSAFPEGLPALDGAARPEHLAKAASLNTFIVIADVDIISDQFIYPTRAFFGSPFANKTLIYNALDFVGGSSDLISVRSRGSSLRQFKAMEAIRVDATARTADRIDAINMERAQFQTELNELNAQATEKNVNALRGLALQRQREITRMINEKDIEIREVQRESREAIEFVENTAKRLTTWGTPLLVSLIGLILWIVRMNRRSQQMREDMA